MIKAYVFEPDHNAVNLLRRYLLSSFPNVQINAESSSPCFHTLLSKETDLVFLNISSIQKEQLDELLSISDKKIELICLGNKEEDAYKAYQLKATDFLLKPLKESSIFKTLAATEQRFQSKKPSSLSKNKDKIGIPTIDGYEYFSVQSIIKCEGLQKCTRVFTTERTNIVSAYNIGEFIKLLSPYGFFAPHKSHLVNLQHVKRYKKDGTIFLTNDLHVPVARRRRAEFLTQIPHL